MTSEIFKLFYLFDHLEAASHQQPLHKTKEMHFEKGLLHISNKAIYLIYEDISNIHERDEEIIHFLHLFHLFLIILFLSSHYIK